MVRLLLILLIVHPMHLYAEELSNKERQQFELKIQNGSARSAYQLAQRYIKQEAWIEAEQWLQHAAMLDYAPAVIDLARYYQSGEMSPPDDAFPEAIKRYGLALMHYGKQMNDPDSLYALAEYYLRFDDEASQAEGNALLKSAAKAGHKEAMLAMAERAMHNAHHGALDATALYWLRRAAKKGSSRAWILLAEFYMGGNGVAQDVSRAKEAANKAALIGHPRAAQVMAALERVRASGAADE